MSKHIVQFTVPFVRGKGRARFVRATGRSYTPDATAEAMERIRMAYAEAADGRAVPRGTAAHVIIETMRTLPKSRPRRVEYEPDTFKPDADNIAKLVLDALNGTAWADDTQVTRLEVLKCPRVRGEAESTHVMVMWSDE